MRRVRSILAASLVLITVALLVLDVAMYVLNRTVPEGPTEQSPEHWLEYLSYTVGVIGILAGAGIGFVLSQRRHRNPIGWLLLFGTALTQLGSAIGELRIYQRNVGTEVGAFGFQMRLPEAEFLVFLSPPARALGLAGAFLFLMILFPDGRLGSAGGRAVFTLTAALTSVFLLEAVFGPSVGGRENPLAVSWLYEIIAYQLSVLNQSIPLSYLSFLLTIPLTGAFFVGRYLRSRGERRLQMKWLGLAAFISAVGLITTLVAYYTKGFFEIFILDIRWADWTMLVLNLGFTLVPIAAAVAIFKYRLYDIEVILKRSILFGSLALFITAGYVALVVALGSALGGRRGLIPSVLATGLVAIAFEPVRSTSEKLANRLVYGKRAAPYQALIQMTEQMRAARPMEEVLPAIAETIAAATGARGVMVTLELSGGGAADGRWGDVPEEAWPSEAGIFPILSDDSVIGDVQLFKSKGNPVNRDDEAVMRALLPRTTLALVNMRLALQLRDHLAETRAQELALKESHRRLTNASLQTRLAFQREVHEAVASNLSQIQDLTPDTSLETEELEDLIDWAAGKTAEALEKVREIARGIFPALLTDRGLAAALEAEISRFPSLEVVVDPSLSS
ncbi:MAG TPA: hypothetical protein VND22_06855, partial [Actinomycetota bacterium]|nr:hypothetical protein [Actinomycetota bacterium]